MNEIEPRSYWPGELAFSVTDYRQKLEGYQDELKQQNLVGALIFDPENIFWLTGYQTIGYFTFQVLYVPVNGLPILVTRIVNRDLALALPTIESVQPICDTDDAMTVLSDYLNQVVPHHLNIGLETESWCLKVSDYRQLIKLSKINFIDHNGYIQQQRIIKTPAQIKRMKSAARAVEQGMAQALKSIAPGKTENDIAAALYQGTIAAGSEYIGHPPMVVAGKRSALCFALWKRNVIKNGDVVLLEGGACVDRYHALMSRTAIVGKPTDEHKSSADALIEILETAIENIKPGVTAGDVDQICRSTIKKKGFEKYYKSRTAYGIGIGFPPNWAEGHIYSIRPNDEKILEENMTFHIIPTIFREDFGMAISDSVRVCGNGCEVLTQYPRDLVIID